MLDVVGVITFVAGLVLGAFVDRYVSEQLRRPRLQVNLGGSGNGLASISLKNTLGFVGISIGQTVLFGRDVTGGRRFGRPLDRHPARCEAPWIKDADNPDGGAWGLCFLLPGVSEPQTSAEIPSGQSATLVLFGVRTKAKQVDFFQPGPDWQPMPGSRHLAFGVPHRFIVGVPYDRATQLLEIPVNVTLDILGNLHLGVYGRKGRRMGSSLIQ